MCDRFAESVGGVIELSQPWGFLCVCGASQHSSTYGLAQIQALSTSDRGVLRAAVDFMSQQRRRCEKMVWSMIVKWKTASSRLSSTSTRLRGRRRSRRRRNFHSATTRFSTSMATRFARAFDRGQSLVDQRRSRLVYLSHVAGPSEGERWISIDTCRSTFAVVPCDAAPWALVEKEGVRCLWLLGRMFGECCRPGGRVRVWSWIRAMAAAVFGAGMWHGSRVFPRSLPSSSLGRGLESHRRPGDGEETSVSAQFRFATAS